MKEKLFMISKFLVLDYVLFVALITLLRPMEKMWMKVLALIVLIPAGWLMFQRDTYLPFLGKAALPASVIVDDRVPEQANTELQLQINAPDGTKLIYWGAEPNANVVSNPWDAYNKYTNTGVATVRNGAVTIKFKCPAEYKIPIGKKLKRHIHYRLCCEKNAMMGPIETVYVNC